MDNYALYPISSNYAVLFVSPIWKAVYLNPEIVKEMFLFSPILFKYLDFPRNDYVNRDKMKVDEDIAKYADENDKYTYAIKQIIVGSDKAAAKVINLTPNTLFLSMGANYNLQIREMLLAVMQWLRIGATI